MKEKTCCFTGHRELPEEDLERIRALTKQQIEKLLTQGVVRFICGGAAGFDLLCAGIVAELKKEFPQIQLIHALAWDNQERYFKPQEQAAYRQLLALSDEVVYVSHTYFRGCTHKRNRYMADHASYIIVYCTRESGGSYYTKRYAKSKGLTVIDISA